MRLTMTKTDDEILLDFAGTDPETKVPINWPLDYADGRFLRKWMGPVLRSLAESPERAAEIDINEGVLDVIKVQLPEKGSMMSPTYGRPSGMRFFLMLRSLGLFAACLSKATGGKLPADHETIRIWGVHGGRNADDFFLFREVLGGVVVRPEDAGRLEGDVDLLLAPRQRCWVLLAERRDLLVAVDERVALEFEPVESTLYGVVLREVVHVLDVHDVVDADEFDPRRLHDRPEDVAPDSPEPVEPHPHRIVRECFTHI
jgi:hypothetical protein